MWNDDDYDNANVNHINQDDEVDQYGRPVRLYLPTQGPSRRHHHDTNKTTTNNKTLMAPFESHIGGYAYKSNSKSGGGGGVGDMDGDDDDDNNNRSMTVVPTCDQCNDPLWLLVQLQVDDDHDDINGSIARNNKSNSSSSSSGRHRRRRRRHIMVFCCPKEECFATLTFDQGFVYGTKGGVVKCLQQQVVVDEADTVASTKEVVMSAKPPQPVVPVVAPTKSSWYADGDDDNDWGLDDRNADVHDGKDQQMCLEDAVASMERGLDEDGAVKTMQAKETSKKTAKKYDKSQHTAAAVDDTPIIKNCQAFPFYLLKAQDEPMATLVAMEDDDVGLAEPDEKIRKMLARYMAEEEDQDLVAVLRGTNTGGGGGSGGGGTAEEDERLSDEERLLRGFQDRLRRVPQQVVRAAPGGLPLWSISDKDRKSGKPLWKVPSCGCCGGNMRFECQLMPSILSILEVDRYAGNSKKNTEGSLSLDDLLSNGLNFGALAIFACPEAKCVATSADEDNVFWVLQQSVDEDTVSSEEKKNGTSQKRTVPELSGATMAVVEDLDDDDDFEPDA